MRTIGLLVAAVIWVGGAAPAAAASLMGVACTRPPAAHCEASGCTADLLADTGAAVEPKSGRKFFLDFPCDLKAGEKVTVVLALHGGGSIGNWQRHYFPIVDYKDRNRLVIATPSGTGRSWKAEKDDAYVRGVVEAVYGAVGPKNVRAFWLAGHSLGGQTSNRLLTQPFYRDKLTGWVSLSGGRLGSKREEVRAPIPAQTGAAAPPTGAMRLAADASVLPPFPFSFIYETGEHELTAAGLPPESKWARRLGCVRQSKTRTVVDTQPGYVNDTRPQSNPNPIWGGKARPGSARIYTYPRCQEGRVVADIVRLDKGHTEGLEPHITEEIVRMMMSAPSGPSARGG